VTAKSYSFSYLLSRSLGDALNFCQTFGRS
jgi:hypothetical protein